MDALENEDLEEYANKLQDIMESLPDDWSVWFLAFSSHEDNIMRWMNVFRINDARQRRRVMLYDQSERDSFYLLLKIGKLKTMKAYRQNKGSTRASGLCKS